MTVSSELVLSDYPKLAPEVESSLRGIQPNLSAGQVAVRGDPEILQTRTLALFCSVKCPGKLILQTYDLAMALRKAGVTVISGFHSPMEKECLSLLLRGTQPVVICPGRSIDGMRIPSEWKKPLAEGRLLLLSPFEEKDCRVTARTAQLRNRFVATLADEVFVAYASPGGRTEQFCREVIGWGKTLLTLDSPDNAHLRALGAQGMEPGYFHSTVAG